MGIVKRGYKYPTETVLSLRNHREEGEFQASLRACMIKALVIL